MKKVCFVADRFFWEEEMGDLLYQEINRISNEDRVVEFYFHTCHEIFAQKAVACIQKLRRERPEKHLSIIAIIDPLRWGEDKFNEEIPFRHDQFPVVVLTGLILLPHLTVNVIKTKGASFNTFIRLTAGFTINVMT